MIAALRKRIPFNRPVNLYMLAIIIVGTTLFNGIYVVLFNLYLLRLGYGPEFIGQANAIGLFANAVFSLPAGMAATRWGLKRTITWGLVTSIICHALLPLFEFAPPSWRDAGILAMRGMSWLGMSLFWVNAVPLLMAITTATERNLAFSVRTGLLPFSGFFGSLAGGLLPGLLAQVTGTSEQMPGPYRYALILSCLLCIPAIHVIKGIRLRELDGEGRAQQALSDGPFPWAIFWAIFLVGILRPAALGAVRTFFNVYLDEALGLNTAEIGVLFSIIWLTSAPVPLLMPAMAKRWGLKTTVIISSLGEAASAALMALVPTWIAASVARFGMAGLSSVTFAAISIFVMKLVRPRWQPAMSGLLNMAMGLSWATISLGGGYIIAGQGFPTLFLLGTGTTVLGVLLWAWHFRLPRGEMTDANVG